MIGYNADSAELHGSISHWPYTSGNSPDATREVYSWDLGRKLGEIPEKNDYFWSTAEGAMAMNEFAEMPDVLATLKDHKAGLLKKKA